MATTTTLLQLVEDVASNLDALEQGTATGGAVNYLLSTNFPFLSSTRSTADYVNSVLLISNTTDSNAPIGEERGIISYAPTTGNFAPAANFSAAVGTGDTFDIFKRGVSFSDLKAAVNRCLRNLKYPRIAPLTLVTDGDMEASGVTNWVATDATSSKLTTGTLYGAQSLRVLNSAANGYATSAAIAVIPSTSYVLQARVRTITGTGNLVAYDATNSADITYESWTYSGWGTINFTFNTPATCESLTVRLRNDGASDDSYWDHVILLRTGAREVPLPSWITQSDQVRRVLYGGSDDKFDNDALMEVVSYNLRPDILNPSYSFWLVLPHTIHGALWVEAMQSFSELSTYSGTTMADRLLVSYGGTVEMLSQLMARYRGDAGIPYRQDYARYLQMFHARYRQIAPPSIVRPKLRYGANSPPPRFL